MFIYIHILLIPIEMEKRRIELVNIQMSTFWRAIQIQNKERYYLWDDPLDYSAPVINFSWEIHDCGDHECIPRL